MIGAFCIHSFTGQKDIEEYYNSIITYLSPNSTINNDISTHLEKMERYKELLWQHRIITRLDYSYPLVPWD